MMYSQPSLQQWRMMQDFAVNYKPLQKYFLPEAVFSDHGKKILKMGKIGAIVLAGGHGSRLGYDAPKGCFPVLNKSLYQRLAEKVAHASTVYGQDFHLAIMTSDATHRASVEHFEKAQYFGLKKEQVVFFQQQNLPLQDESGKDVSLTAPDGNGKVFWHFAQSGHLDAWQNYGIEHITVFTIDNALVDPFEPHLVGMHDQHKNDVSVVGIVRDSPEEHVGVIVEQDAKLAVIEYSEMPDSQRLAFDAAGHLKYPLANISYFAFSLAFVNKILKKDLPIHKAKKKVRSGLEDAYFYKSEYFIFDLLTYSDKAEVLLLPREDFFAPLKNKTGPQSIVTVEAALKAHKSTKY